MIVAKAKVNRTYSFVHEQRQKVNRTYSFVHEDVRVDFVVGED